MVYMILAASRAFTFELLGVGFQNFKGDYLRMTLSPYLEYGTFLGFFDK